MFLFVLRDEWCLFVPYEFFYLFRLKVESEYILLPVCLRTGY